MASSQIIQPAAAGWRISQHFKDKVLSRRLSPVLQLAWRTNR